MGYKCILKFFACAEKCFNYTLDYLFKDLSCPVTLQTKLPGVIKHHECCIPYRNGARAHD